MTGRSGRGRWERVVSARREARVALGRDPSGGDLYAAPPKRKSQPAPAPGPIWVSSATGSGRGRRGAFTLIELVVVIAIIAILNNSLAFRLIL